MSEPPVPQPAVFVPGWADAPVSGDRVDVSTEPIVVGDPKGERIEIAQTAFEGQPGAAFYSPAGVAALGAPIDWIADMPSVAPGGIGLFAGTRIGSSGRVYAGPGDAIIHAATPSGGQAWVRTDGWGVEIVVTDGLATTSIQMTPNSINMTAPGGVHVNGTRIG